MNELYISVYRYNIRIVASVSSWICIRNMNIPTATIVKLPIISAESREMRKMHILRFCMRWLLIFESMFMCLLVHWCLYKINQIEHIHYVRAASESEQGATVENLWIYWKKKMSAAWHCGLGLASSVFWCLRCYCHTELHSCTFQQIPFYFFEYLHENLHSLSGRIDVNKTE